MLTCRSFLSEGYSRQLAPRTGFRLRAARGPTSLHRRRWHRLAPSFRFSPRLSTLTFPNPPRASPQSRSAMPETSSFKLTQAASVKDLKSLVEQYKKSSSGASSGGTLDLSTVVFSVAAFEALARICAAAHTPTSTGFNVAEQVRSMQEVCTWEGFWGALLEATCSINLILPLGSHHQVSIISPITCIFRCSQQVIGCSFWA